MFCKSSSTKTKVSLNVMASIWLKIVGTVLVGRAYLAGTALLSFGGATAESLTSGATVLGNIGRAVASVVAAIKEAIDDFMNDGD